MATSARVPLTVTHKMRRELQGLGLSDAEIDSLTPAEAWDVLGGMPAAPTDAAALLAYLHRGGSWACYWTDEGRLSHWLRADNPAPIPDGWRNVYFGVHPLLQSGSAYERSTIANVAAINCLFAELDAKDYGDKAAALAHVQEVAPAASVIVDSGGGYHAYWLLADPFPLDTDTAREHARALQRQWVAYAGGDGGAKDLARVLRVPGTLNFKYDPPRPVEVVQMDLARTYTLPQLEGYLPAETIQPAPAPARINGNGHENPGEFWLDRAFARVIPHGGDQGRNATGFWLACQLRDAGISEGEAELILAAYARQVPQDQDPYTERDALASVRQAYGRAAREPAQKAGSITLPTNRTGRQEQPTTTDTAKPEKQPTPTDDELAARWIIAHPNTAWGLGEFRRYSGGIWPVLPADEMRREVLDVLQRAKSEGVRPTARLLNSVVEIARVSVAVPADCWDCQHDLLICSNGALHIPTRNLQPHNPKHYATSRLEFAYDPAAAAEVWDYFLNRCAYEARDFLQEFAGYSLTTDTRYELAVWLHGQPGGGKSTFLAGLQAMLGNRAGVLGLADIERSRFALTQIPGKTLIVSTEQPSDYLAATHYLNAIISGEPIEVDRKFKDPFTLVPRAKLAWAMNDLPRVGSGGSGLFRRVKVVTFPPIPESERDPEIKERIKQEGAGILNWALDGLLRLRERGKFEVPKGVQDATKNFEEANDIPALFVSECCVVGEDYRAQGSVLYGAYSEWCKSNGHKPASSTRIAEDWRRLGFEKHPIRGLSWWKRVGVKQEYMPGVDTR